MSLSMHIRHRSPRRALSHLAVRRVVRVDASDSAAPEGRMKTEAPRKRRQKAEIVGDNFLLYERIAHAPAVQKAQEDAAVQLLLQDAPEPFVRRWPRPVRVALLTASAIGAWFVLFRLARLFVS
jgi:hypothetical protein